MQDPSIPIASPQHFYQKSFAFTEYSLPGNWEMVALYISQQIDNLYDCKVDVQKRVFNSDTLIVFVLTSESVADLADACFLLFKLAGDIDNEMIQQNKNVEIVGPVFELIYLKELQDADNNINAK